MTGLFVGFALMFPRLTLFVCWVGSAIPANDTAFALDVVGALVAPRLLVGWWLWSDPAWGGWWAFLFFVVSLFAGGGSSGAASRSGRKSSD